MKRFLTLLVCFAVVCFCAPIVSAHPGGTDASGGHTDRSTGDYHYHHGYSAHDHYDMDGDGIVDCPYDFEDKTDHSPSTKNSPSNSNGATRSPVGESTQKAKKTSFWDVLVAIFESLFPALGLSFLVTYFLSFLLQFLISDDHLFEVSRVVFFLIFAVLFVSFIIKYLSRS